MKENINYSKLFINYGRVVLKIKNEIYDLIDNYSGDQNIEFPKHIFDFCFVDILHLKNLAEQKSFIKRVDNFSFTLTGSDSIKQYAICRRISILAKDGYESTCMIIITRKPWFELFADILQIQELIHQNEDKNKYDFLKELYEQTLPDPGNPFKSKIPYKKQLNRAFITLKRPLRGYGDIDCENLFSSLSIHRILSFFMDVMQEKKIVVYSDNLGKVSSTVRTIVAFLYPFKWQHIFIPLLPQKLLDYCCATIPFLVGTHVSLIEELKKRPIENDVVFLNLDLPLSNQVPKDYQVLPRPVKLLGDSLFQLESLHKNSIEWGNEVTETFMKFFLDVFWEYKKYIINGKFDKISFIKTKFTSKEFIQNFCETQMFACFIDERIVMNSENRKDYFDKKSEEYANQGIRAVGKFFGDVFSKAKTNFFLKPNSNSPQPSPSKSQESPQRNFFNKSDTINSSKQNSIPSINLIDLSNSDNNNNNNVYNGSLSERRSLLDSLFSSENNDLSVHKAPQPYKSNPTDYKTTETNNLLDISFNQPYQSTPLNETQLSSQSSQLSNIFSDQPIREVKEIKLVPIPTSNNTILLESLLQPEEQLSPKSDSDVSYETFAKDFEKKHKGLTTIQEEETN